MRLAEIGLLGLALLGLAYWLTIEPAPSIRVRWRDDITSQQQALLERKYLLSNGRASWGHSIAYDLLDTRQANVKALVLDPAVTDTNDIDRDHYIVPVDTAYGERWMWVAHRMPGLRDPRVRWLLIVALVVMVIAGRRFRAGRSARDRGAVPR